MPPKAKEEKKAVVRFGRVRSNLKMGLVGLPNVGKSSLFNLLCNASAAASNFAFWCVTTISERYITSWLESGPLPQTSRGFLCLLHPNL